MSSAAERWRDDLGSWAIPDAILAQAPVPPWVHPPAMFTVDAPTTDGSAADAPPPTPSVRAALAGLDGAGTLLDVGCGGGGSSAPVIDAAPGVVTHCAGVDEQQAMLDNFARACAQRSVPCSTHLGVWPAVAASVPPADVVVCHHVAYNVGEIEPFLRELTAHARRRVVVELPVRHPTSPFNPLWRHVWGIERPERPTDADFADVVSALGWEAHVEHFTRPARKPRLDSADYIAFVRTRLCLPESRDAEVADALRTVGLATDLTVATVWWDVPTG